MDEIALTGLRVRGFHGVLPQERAEGQDFLIQPVTIAYTRLNGMPITRERLPDIAWIGDTALMPHLFAFMSLGKVRAELIFHPPVRRGDFADRKALARHCHAVVADGYSRLMRGM